MDGHSSARVLPRGQYSSLSQRSCSRGVRHTLPASQGAAVTVPSGQKVPLGQASFMVALRQKQPAGQRPSRVASSNDRALGQNAPAVKHFCSVDGEGQKKPAAHAASAAAPAAQNFPGVHGQHPACPLAN